MLDTTLIEGYTSLESLPWWWLLSKSSEILSSIWYNCTASTGWHKIHFLTPYGICRRPYAACTSVGIANTWSNSSKVLLLVSRTKRSISTQRMLAETCKWDALWDGYYALTDTRQRRNQRHPEAWKFLGEPGMIQREQSWTATLER